MNTNIKLLAVLIVGLAIGGGAAWIALQARLPAGKSEAAKDMGHAMGQDMAQDMSGKTAPAKAEKEILYWYDPMVPDQHFDKPGKSPFMDMDLVPKYAADAGAGGGVSIDPRVVQNLGIRTATAEQGRLWRRIDTVGYVRADDNRIEVLHASTAGSKRCTCRRRMTRCNAAS